MPLLTYKYVYFPSGGPHTRQPRSIGGSGGFTPIGNLSGPAGTLQANTPFQIPPGTLPPSEVVGNTTYTFAFVNVSGGTGGGATAFNPSSPPQVMVGTAPIVVLVVYLASASGHGGSGTGASIDAFDETVGTLVDDTFVTVSPDGSLTQNANVDGWVPTTNAGTIAASTHITPTNANFEKWVDLTDTSTPPGVDFLAKKTTNYAVLAFYKSPATVGPPPLTPCEQLVENIQKVTMTGVPGLRFPVAQWDQIKSQLQKCVNEREISQQTYNTVVAAYESYASGPHVPPNKSSTP